MSEQQLADREVRDAQDAIRGRLPDLNEEIVRVVGWVALYRRLGYGPHVATRDSKLPRAIREWIEDGCPE